MATSQFDDLAAPITSANADLKAEIVDGVDTLGCTIGISEPEMAKLEVRRQGLEQMTNKS